MKHPITRILTTILSVAMLTGSAGAQTDTTFTYQGELMESGSAADGFYSMSFKLFDALSGGSQVGSTVSYIALSVEDGLFNAQLDFGAQEFGNEQYWLEVIIVGNTLSPRQLVTASPFSIQTRGINVADNGFVGIGRSDELTGNEVFGIHRPGSSFGGMYSTTDAGGLPFYGYSTGDKSAYHYLDGPTGDWKLFIDGIRMTVTDGGKVGIGTESPAQQLHVTASSATAIYGHATSSNSAAIGVYGRSNSSSGRGVYGYANSLNGFTQGVSGLSDSVIGVGVRGEASASSGVTNGVLGITQSTSGRGVYGEANSSTGTTYGLYGFSRSNSGYGVYGKATGISGETYGMYGRSDSTSGYGVYGKANASTGITYGSFGMSDSISGRGMFGYATHTTGVNYGVIGRSDSASGFDFYAGGAGANYGATSSRRWKNNIVNIDNPLDKLAQLRGVYFDWDEEHGGSHDVGMIAEEVGKVLPEIVNYEENSIDAIGMDYSKMTPLLVEAVNTLHEQQRAKDAEISQLRDQNASLHARLKLLEILVERIARAQQEEDSQ